jgi:hypothetical protein
VIVIVSVPSRAMTHDRIFCLVTTGLCYSLLEGNCILYGLLHLSSFFVHTLAPASYPLFCYFHVFPFYLLPSRTSTVLFSLC